MNFYDGKRSSSHASSEEPILSLRASRICAVSNAGDWVPWQLVGGRIRDTLRAFRQGLKDAGYVEGQNVGSGISRGGAKTRAC